MTLDDQVDDSAIGFLDGVVKQPIYRISEYIGRKTGVSEKTLEVGVYGMGSACMTAGAIMSHIYVFAIPAVASLFYAFTGKGPVTSKPQKIVDGMVIGIGLFAFLTHFTLLTGGLVSGDHDLIQINAPFLVTSAGVFSMGVGNYLHRKD